MKINWKYEFEAEDIISKSDIIQKKLNKIKYKNKIKIAILGGSTIFNIIDQLKTFLNLENFDVEVYESDYNQYFQEIMFNDKKLKKFNPDIIYIFTNIKNLNQNNDLSKFDKTIKDEINKFSTLWKKVLNDYNSILIQNNFEYPDLRPNGNFELNHSSNIFETIDKVNFAFSKFQKNNKNFYVFDINYLSSVIGLVNWHATDKWYAYKIPIKFNVMPYFSYNLSCLITTILKGSKKCLVLDLDNTLWGGIIGEIGSKKININPEDPIGESFLDFQKYCLKLKNNGVILAVCSKNDFEIAKKGFDNPNSILSFEDFSCFKANWEEKYKNIYDISKELNIGLDSMVFVDDSKFEQENVKVNLPEVEVIKSDGNPINNVELIDKSLFFQKLSITKEDTKRTKYYTDNKAREDEKQKFTDYKSFLKDLKMKALIINFKENDLERITQLINKTNQFNFTTERLTFDQVKKIMLDKKFISISTRLSDKFGDNGLVSILIGKINNDILEINNWLMSCRVFNRDLEKAIMDNLINQCKIKKIKKIIFYYIPTPKNSMIKNLVKEFSFVKLKNKNKFNLKYRNKDKSKIFIMENLKKKYNTLIKVNNGY